jgi:hypothetical protein
MARTWMLLILVLLAGPRTGGAQSKGAAPSGFDSFIMLVPPRDSTTIKRQIRATAEERAQAESRRQQAETMRLGATARIEAKKVEIVRIKERIELAKKEKRDADRLGMEAERKAAEREIDLLKRRAQLRQAEIELETRRAELAGFTKSALELELQLAVRRAGRLRTPAGGAGGASQERVIGELEKQTLDAQRAQSESSIDVSDAQTKVIDRRLELLDAQQKILGGK